MARLEFNNKVKATMLDKLIIQRYKLKKENTDHKFCRKILQSFFPNGRLRFNYHRMPI